MDEEVEVEDLEEVVAAAEEGLMEILQRMKMGEVLVDQGNQDNQEVHVMLVVKKVILSEIVQVIITTTTMKMGFRQEAKVLDHLVVVKALVHPGKDKVLEPLKAEVLEHLKAEVLEHLLKVMDLVLLQVDLVEALGHPQVMTINQMVDLDPHFVEIGVGVEVEVVVEAEEEDNLIDDPEVIKGTNKLIIVYILFNNVRG